MVVSEICSDEEPAGEDVETDVLSVAVGEDREVELLLIFEMSEGPEPASFLVLSSSFFQGLQSMVADD